MHLPNCSGKREQERKEDRGNCLMLNSTLCMRIYLPLSDSHAHISPPLIPHSSPTPSLFTLHRHLINMPLAQQRGGKTQSVPPASRRCSHCRTCIIWHQLPCTVAPSQDHTLHAIEAVCTGYAEDNTQPVANSYAQTERRHAVQ